MLGTPAYIIEIPNMKNQDANINALLVNTILQGEEQYTLIKTYNRLRRHPTANKHKEDGYHLTELGAELQSQNPSQLVKGWSPHTIYSRAIAAILKCTKQILFPDFNNYSIIH